MPTVQVRARVLGRGRLCDAPVRGVRDRVQPPAAQPLPAERDAGPGEDQSEHRMGSRDHSSHL